jgi:hypothetical protein
MSAEYTPQELYRYELKYIIPEFMIEPISSFASIYCHLDDYSESSDDGFYIINNLYLDSPGCHFAKNRLEEVNGRFNMRVRSYGCNPVAPYYFEIKQKYNSILKKTRAKVDECDWPHVLQKEDYVLQEPGNEKNRKNLAEYLKQAQIHNIEPKVFMQYRRKAYISHYDDYARLTLDKDIRFREEHSYSVHPSEDMIRCDNSKCYLKNKEVILELKCYTTSVPLWMIDLIRTFNLQKTAFSKYLVGLRDVYYKYRYDDLYSSLYINNVYE